MRTDIAIDFDTADLSLSRKPPRYTVAFEWVAEDETYVYGKCVFNDDISPDNLSGGIGVKIPQMMRYKPVMVSFWSIDGTGTAHSLMNPTTKGSDFPLLDLSGKKVEASTLLTISETSSFQLNIDTDKVYLSDMYSRDLMSKESLEQNEELLLRCYSSNLYQFPTTGVGLLSFLHANMHDNGIRDKIKEEFNRDNMEVDEAIFDYDSGKIIIKAREREVK